MPRWHKVWAVARKEVSDILRDRRTVFMAIVFPLILYPLLIIGLIQGTVVEVRRQEAARPAVAIHGGDRAPDLVAKFEADKGLKLLDFGGKRLPRNAAAGVVIPEEFAAKIAAGETASLQVLFDSADQASLNALDRVAGVVDAYRKDVLGARLEARGLADSFVQPVKLDQKDVATPRKRGVFKLGKILAFLLVTFCLMGALYPALDAVAGEKERGTLETLLSIPATRLEVLAGKYVAVFGMSVASVVSNFVSLSATMFLVNRMLGAVSATDAPIDFRVPVSAVFLLVPALLPLAAFFSAISLGIAAYAKSTREGQYYLAPLYAGALPLTAVALIGSVNLNYFTALVPITGISLFLKDGLLGTLAPGPTVVALVSTAGYAALALWWAASVFSREDVLFGAPRGEVEISPAARGTPTASHAILVWVVSIILFFYVGSQVGIKLGAMSALTALIIYVVLITGPAIILVAVERLNWRKLFPFGPLGGRGALSLLFFIPAAILVNIAAMSVQQLVSTPSAPPDLGGVSALTLFLSLAALPAVFEEVFYRGLLLQTFQARMSATAAVLLSAALFAAAHLNPAEALPLFALGVVLAFVMRATGTLRGAIIVHFANNAFTLLVFLKVIEISFEPGRTLGAVLLVGAFAAGAALVAGGRVVARRAAESR